MPSYSFLINGKPVTVDAPADMPLLWVLRDMLNVTGPKYGCGTGVCRACTSHLDGGEIQPCVVPVADCADREVTTIEGLADGDELHPVQQAWLDRDVAQCGFCQPGQIMAAVALLKKTRHPTDADIDRIENVCRCGTYSRIREAIKKGGGERLTFGPWYWRMRMIIRQRQKGAVEHGRDDETGEEGRVTRT